MKLDFESNVAAPFVGNNYADSAAAQNVVKDTSQMLQAGIKAAQAGRRAEARTMLLQVTEADPQNENAWLWMASISEYPEELLVFLNNVLAVNPANARALEWAQATKSMLAKNFVQRGIDASNEANMDLAKQCFLQAIVHDAQNEMAWLWMASISDSTDEKISHLQKVLSINPKNETAQASLQAAKNQVADALLQKANRAAISGDREEAAKMLEEILRNAPELEEAWMLKSYLADSFSDKITCYERVLAINPDNDAANSGMASLKAMIAQNETKKTGQLAMIAELMKNHSGDTGALPVYEAAIIVDEPADAHSPTQELNIPLAFVESNNQFENSQPSESDARAQTKTVEFNASQFAAQTVSPQDRPIPQPFSFESNQTDSAAIHYTQSRIPMPAMQNFGDEKQPLKPAGDAGVACPFCRADNEPNAYVCASCRTILTLSDLEMLLAHTEGNNDAVRRAVGQMEAEKSQRDFDANELKTLALGYINLKNLRQGVVQLQAALRMNPNDVMLGSQVNSLKIRLFEIEHMESTQSSIAKGRKILVVDDSATVRKLISSKLEKVGHEVVCAIDGIEALEKIKDFTPELILLDINMPQMDGYQVCKLIRTNEATKDVPVVMISGNDGFFDKVRGRMSGTSGYITKPFGPETLMKIIESYIV